MTCGEGEEKKNFFWTNSKADKMAAVAKLTGEEEEDGADAL